MGVPVEFKHIEMDVLQRSRGVLLKNIRVGFLLVSLGVTVHSHADWADTEGKKIYTGYGIDSFDYLSGQAQFLHSDYELIMGPSYNLPLMRSFGMMADTDLGLGFETYNLGQLKGYKPSSTYCSDHTKDFGAQFRSPNGQSINFYRASSTGATYNFQSNSGWLLECKGTAVTVKAPNGIRFTYAGSGGSNGVYDQSGFRGTSPKSISDDFGNTANLSYSSNGAITSIQTRWQLVKFNYGAVSGGSGPRIKGAIINGEPAEFVTYSYGSNRGELQKVTYVENSSWTYNFTSVPFTVCNPLKTCLKLYIKNYTFDLQGKNSISDTRVYKKEYVIPQFGTVMSNVDYSYVGEELIVTTALKDFTKTYRYQRPFETDKSYLNGNLVRESTIAKGKTFAIEEVSYEYEAQTPALEKPGARLKAKTTVRRSDSTGNGREAWNGTVLEKFLDYDQWNRAQTHEYRYPREGYITDPSQDIQPKLVYRTMWQLPSDKSVHNLGLVTQTSLDGLVDTTDYTYGPKGQLFGQDTNGISEAFLYNNFGEMTSHTDGEGNTTYYSDFAFGIARQVDDAEGRNTTRIVKNGRVIEETFFGATDKWQYDGLGNLEKRTFAEATRKSITYDNGYPVEGGMILVEDNGDLIKRTHLNGMGLPSKIDLHGYGSGAGPEYHYVTYFGYNEDGSIKWQSIAMNLNDTLTEAKKNKFERDALGRTTFITSPGGDRISFQYNGPFTLRVIDGNGVTTDEFYRPFALFGAELLSKRTHLAGNSSPSATVNLEIVRHNNGKIDKVGINGVYKNYQYDRRWMLDYLVTKEEGKIDYAYDNSGRLLSEKHDTGALISYTYDGVGRIVGKNVAGDANLNIRYSYADNERKVTAVKGNYTYRWATRKDGLLDFEEIEHRVGDAYEPIHVSNAFPSYNPSTNQAGSIKEVSGKYNPKVTSDGVLNWKLQYQYDEQGNLDSLTYPDGEVVGYVRNRLGKASQVGSYIRNALYYPNGGLREITYGNGIKSSVAQDANSGELTGIKHGNFWQQQFKYSAGMVSEILDLDSPVNSRKMAYDQLYQLKEVKSVANDSSLEKFSFDVYGNLERYDSPGLVFDPVIDATTNRISRTVTNGSSENVGYGPGGRIQSYGNKTYSYAKDETMSGFKKGSGPAFSYQYDTNGNKILTLKGTGLDHYSLYSGNGQLMHEVRADGKSTNYFYLDNRLVSKRDALYKVEYEACAFVNDATKGKTILSHRPVYIDKNGDPVHTGECEYWQTWNHLEDVQGWVYPGNTSRDYIVHRYHQDPEGNNIAYIKSYTQKYQFKRKIRERRDYVSRGTWRHYYCYMEYHVIEQMYDHNKVLLYKDVKKSSGSYKMSAKKSWRAWQKKPKFSCPSESLNLDAVAWP